MPALSRAGRAIAIAASSVALLLGLSGVALAHDYDGDGFQPPADCDDLDPAVNPLAADRPDLDGADSNCDGIDGDVAKAIFVDGATGLDANPGTQALPLKTIGAAIAKAAQGQKDVYVTGGGYAGPLTLISGVGVYGGYRAGFAGPRDALTAVAGAPAAAVADSVRGVVLQRLTLQGRQLPASGLSVYGLRVVNGSSVLLEGDTVTADNGLPGTNGTTLPRPAPPMSRGGDGNDGACATNALPPTATRGIGVPVETLTGYGSSGQGGDGGDGGRTSAESGHDGKDAPGAPRGSGGTAGKPGGDGADGTAGANGADGANAIFSLAAVTPLWTPAPAGAGDPGGHGIGGSGGGGGLGDSDTSGANAGGGSGGGGGGGGFGGAPGGVGTSGGGSFGAYVVGSSLVAVDSTLHAGGGGRGGDSGAGGLGGDGSLGGDRGLGARCGQALITGDGGRGGRGGRGGNAGAGGAGTGGPGAGVLRAGTGSSFTAIDTTESFGSGGTGGTRRSNPALPAANGPAGGILFPTGLANGPSDFDGDGFMDDVDVCPGDRGPALGCPAPSRLADGDGDGVPDADDACPAVPGGPTDTDGDGCPGVPTPAPTPISTPVVQPAPTAVPTPRPTRIVVTVSFFVKAAASRTKFTRLSVKGISRGATLTVTCRGRGCPHGLTKKGFVKRNASGTVSLARFIHKPIPVTARITIVVAKPGRIAAVKIITLRRARPPVIATRCKPPGATKPVAC